MGVLLTAQSACTRPLTPRESRSTTPCSSTTQQLLDHEHGSELRAGHTWQRLQTERALHNCCHSDGGVSMEAAAPCRLHVLACSALSDSSYACAYAWHHKWSYAVHQNFLLPVLFLLFLGRLQEDRINKHYPSNSHEAEEEAVGEHEEDNPEHEGVKQVRPGRPQDTIGKVLLLQHGSRRVLNPPTQPTQKRVIIIRLGSPCALLTVLG